MVSLLQRVTLQKRQSNPSAFAPSYGLRCAQVPSLRLCSVGTPPRAIHGPSRLSRHPCRSTHSTEPPLGLPGGLADQKHCATRRPIGRPAGLSGGEVCEPRTYPLWERACSRWHHRALHTSSYRLHRRQASSHKGAVQFQALTFAVATRLIKRRECPSPQPSPRGRGGCSAEILRPRAVSCLWGFKPSPLSRLVAAE